jgi:hypothetical protein
MIIYVSEAMRPLLNGRSIVEIDSFRSESTGTYAEIDLVDTTGRKRAFGCFLHTEDKPYWQIEPWFAEDPKRKVKVQENG